MDNKLKTIAVVFGIIMLIIGTLGFFPQFMTGSDLFGLFRVNTNHNIIHLVTGAVALICGLSSVKASLLFFKIFGVIYGLVALIGLYHGNQDLFNGLIANNIHDVWLHAIISAVALYLGFFSSENRLKI